MSNLDLKDLSFFKTFNTFSPENTFYIQ